MDAILNDIAVAGMLIIVGILVAISAYSFIYWIRHGERW